MKILHFLLASLLVFVIFFWEPAPKTPNVLDFQISTVDGEFFLKNLNRQQNLVLFFGYTFCPDICPSTLLELSSVLNQLPPSKLKNLEVFFITLDPARDTPKYLKEYTDFFHPKIQGALAKDLPKMAKALGVQFQQNKNPPFLIDHTADLIVIPKAKKMKQGGQSLFKIPYGTSSAEILKILEEKL